MSGNMDTIDPTLLVNMTLGQPPPGKETNFINPETFKTQAEISMNLCMAVAAVFIILRLYAKISITKMYGWDDVWCILAFAGLVAHDAVSISLLAPGKGRILGGHMWDIKALDITKATLQKTLASVCLYAVAALFVKLSILCLYLRLFKVKTTVRWLIYGGMAACSILYTASVISNMILFVPPPGQPQTLAGWSAKAAAIGNNANHLAIFQGAFGTLSDIYLLVIPVQSILVLNLPLAKRIGVSLIFMTGIIATACSIGSLVFRVKVLSSTDLMWDSVKIYIFSSAEITAGIVCACTPVCAAVFRSGKGNFFSSFAQRYLSRTRRSQKSYGTPSEQSADSGDRKFGFARPPRQRGEMDSESTDGLYSTQPKSGCDSSTRSVELTSVVVK